MNTIKMCLITFVIPLFLVGCLNYIENKPKFKIEKWVKKEFKLYNKKLTLEFPKTKLFGEEITSPKSGGSYEFLIGLNYDNHLFMRPQFNLTISMEYVSPTYFPNGDINLQLQNFNKMPTYSGDSNKNKIIKLLNGEVLFTSLVNSDGNYIEIFYKVFDINRILMIYVEYREYIADDNIRFELRKKIALEIVSRIKIELTKPVTLSNLDTSNISAKKTNVISCMKSCISINCF